jgi:2-polyprenyl-3-methyl-5-hydroxy-6-metoxy-1,4-benzoquinol methylase
MAASETPQSTQQEVLRTACEQCGTWRAEAAAKQVPLEIVVPMNVQQEVFAGLYRRSPRPEALPWDREEPPARLVLGVVEQCPPGRTLELGCGAGVHAVYLAQKGFSVADVDFVAAALEFGARGSGRRASPWS